MKKISRFLASWLLAMPAMYLIGTVVDLNFNWFVEATNGVRLVFLILTAFTASSIRWHLWARDEFHRPVKAECE
jgi:hypothetical protein